MHTCSVPTEGFPTSNNASFVWSGVLCPGNWTNRYHLLHSGGKKTSIILNLCLFDHLKMFAASRKKLETQPLDIFSDGSIRYFATTKYRFILYIKFYTLCEFSKVSRLRSKKVDRKIKLTSFYKPKSSLIQNNRNIYSSSDIYYYLLILVAVWINWFSSRRLDF